MRVLQFRAWRSDKTWVCTGEAFPLSAFWRQVETGELTAVGRYTGLRDRDGCPVYEGDICRYRSEGPGTPYEEIAVVRWAGGCFAFGNNHLCELPCTNDRLPLAVIGNTVEHAGQLAPGPRPEDYH